MTRERQAQTDLVSRMAKCLDDASAFCGGFDVAVDKWVDAFVKADRHFQFEELERFVEISQRELEEKERLLGFYKEKLGEEVRKKVVDGQTIKGWTQVLQAENDLLRNKVMAQEKYILAEKSAYRKDFDRTVGLFQGLRDGKSPLGEAMAGVREELKKAQQIFGKAAKKRGPEPEQLLRTLERLAAELGPLRRALDTSQAARVAEDVKIFLSEVNKISKSLRDTFVGEDPSEVLQVLRKDILSLRERLEQVSDAPTKSIDFISQAGFDFRLMYRNIEESVRALVRECHAKDSKLHEVASSLNARNKNSADSATAIIAEQANSAVEVKSALASVLVKLKEAADKPLVDFYQLRNEVRFTMEAQEAATEKLETLNETVKRLCEQNVLRTKLTEEALTEVDSKMMIRKLNEIRNEFFRD